MSRAASHKSFDDQLTEFIKFLQSLWGILAGISVFFPLSNALIKVIPMNGPQDTPPGGLSILSPELITTLATIATLFVILITYRQKDSLRSMTRAACSATFSCSSLMGRSSPC